MVRLVAAAVGAALLLAPSAAKAQAGSVWDELAECESGQRWHLASGNGFFGGLQFSQESWDGAGGQDYAWRADYATRSEQILVAKNLLEMQGWRAWPACSRILGLR